MSAGAGGEGEVTADTLLGGAVRLTQPRRGHRAGTDAVLLAAAAAEPAPGAVIVDAGAGTGAVGLMAARRADGCRLVLLERDPALARLCAKNLRDNGLGARGMAVCANLLAGPVLAHASVDLVLTNPPYFEEGDAPASPQPGRADAHVMRRGGLEAWIGACLRMLRPRGSLVLIQRADKLDACLRHLAPQAGSLVLRAIHPRSGAEASRVIVSAVKGGRAPLRIAPPLMLHAQGGGFTAPAQALHEGASFAQIDAEGVSP